MLSGCTHRHIRKDAYALVKNPGHLKKKYWARGNIDIIDKDLTEFALQLAEYFKLDIPQLDIKMGRPGGVS